MCSKYDMFTLITQKNIKHSIDLITCIRLLLISKMGLVISNTVFTFCLTKHSPITVPTTNNIYDVIAVR